MGGTFVFIGALLTDQQDLVEEVADYLKDIFSGADEPPVLPSQGDSQGISTQGCQHQHQHRDPPGAGGQGDHGYNTDPHPKLQSSKEDKSVRDDPNGFLNKDFSVEEVKEMIRALGSGKAAGWDEVPNEALKEGPTVLVRVLVRLYNTVKNSGVVPESWKRGRLVMVHKKG